MGSKTKQEQNKKDFKSSRPSQIQTRIKSNGSEEKMNILFKILLLSLKVKSLIKRFRESASHDIQIFPPFVLLMPQIR